jgi:hypothetical protein
MSSDVNNIKDSKEVSNLKNGNKPRREFLGKIAYAVPVLMMLGGLKAQAGGGQNGGGVGGSSLDPK